MSYYVEYDPELSSRYPVSPKKRGVAYKICILIILLVVIMLGCLTQSGVRDFLIPGDPEITVQATADLLEQIKSGTPWVDALATFCETVIGGEN